MTYKKYKIKNRFIGQDKKYIKFELSDIVEFKDKKQSFIFCSNDYPFKDYQVGKTIEIDSVSAKRTNSESYHQNLVRKISRNYTGEHYDDYNLPQGGSASWQGIQTVQAQKQMSAYQKEVAYKKFQSAIKWLEKFVEIAYGDQFPDWENRKQFREDGIPRKDIIGNPERTEKLFTFSLYNLEGCTDHPELQEKMKEEFYQWISATRIDVSNCPDKLKYYLFGFNEILEGRGEKIVSEGDNRQDTFDVDSPEYAKALNAFFASLHSGPMQEAREREHSLKDKGYDELKIGSNFSGSEEDGKNVFQRIKSYVLSSLNYQNFRFFPQKNDQRISSNQSNSQIIQDVKNNPQNWRIDEVITKFDELGRTIKKEEALIHNTAEVGYDGAVSDWQQPIYLAERFTVEEQSEINQALGIPQSSKDLIKDIKRNISEFEFRSIIVFNGHRYDATNKKWVRYGEEKWETVLVHKSVKITENDYNEHGYLNIKTDKMFRENRFSQEERDEIKKAVENNRIIERVNKNNWIIANVKSNRGGSYQALINKSAIEGSSLKDGGEFYDKAKFSDEEWKKIETSCQSQQNQQQMASFTNFTNKQTNNNSGNTGLIIVGVVSGVLLIAGSVVVIKKKLNKKNRG